MPTTPLLGLPLMAAAQAQKHVTHNEALIALDALVNLSVLGQLGTPPAGTPVDGASYIVSPGAIGAWAGKDGQIAAFQSGAWNFYPPRLGWEAFDQSAGAFVVYGATGWAPLATAVPAAARPAPSPSSAPRLTGAVRLKVTSPVMPVRVFDPRLTAATILALTALNPQALRTGVLYWAALISVGPAFFDALLLATTLDGKPASAQACRGPVQITYQGA